MTANNQLLVSLFLAVVVYNSAASASEIGEYQNYHDLDHLPVEEIKKPIIPILKQTFSQDHEGYQFSYETGNGIHAQESAYLKKTDGKDKHILVQHGTITYHDEHGHPYTLTYIADENGFQPQGAHLPTPPPIPAEHLNKGSNEELHGFDHPEFQESEVPQGVEGYEGANDAQYYQAQH